MKSHAWEQRNLLDNVLKITDFRGRTPKKLGMDWADSGYLALSALNVKDGYIDISSEAHYGDEALYRKWMSGNDLHKGQVLFTTEAPMGNVAQVPDDKKYILSQRTIAFNVDDGKMTEDFLAVLLKSQPVQNYLLSTSSGGTAKGVSQKTLSNLVVKVPRSLNEQQKIGRWFQAIDTLLTLHQRKWVEFFYPTYFRKFSFLNFWEFFNNRITNAWEQRKLSDGMTEYTDRVFIEDDQIYKQVTVKNTGEISLRGSQPGRNIGRKRQARVNLRDYPMTLIFTRQTVEQGGIGFAKNDVDGCIVTENMPTIAVDGKKFNQDFLVAFFKTYGFRKDVILSNIEGGTAQIAIHEDDILDSSSTFPSLKEQIKIGNFFRTLSQQITLHQRQSVSSDLLGASLHL